MGRRSSRQVRMQVDEIGSILNAKNTLAAAMEFTNLIVRHNLISPDIWIWREYNEKFFNKIKYCRHRKLTSPETEGFYLAITRIPAASNIYQMSVKYYTDKDGFGDISTTEFSQVPHHRIRGLQQYQYTVEYPCKDDVLMWAEIPRRWDGTLMITPAIQKIKKVRKRR